MNFAKVEALKIIKKYYIGFKLTLINRFLWKTIGLYSTQNVPLASNLLKNIHDLFMFVALIYNIWALYTVFMKHIYL